MDDFIKKSGCKLFKKSPWIQGNTKGIHIYIKIKYMIEYSNQQEGDLIKKKCGKK